MQPLAISDPPRQHLLAEPAASGPAPRRHAWDVPAVTPTAAPSFAHSGLLAMLGGHPVFPGWPNVSPAGPDWFLPDSRAFFPMLDMLGMRGCTPPCIPNMPNGTGKHALYAAQLEVPLHAGAQCKRSHVEVMHAKAGAASDAAATGVQAHLPLEQQSTHPTAKGTRPGSRPKAPTAAPLPMGSHSSNEPSADSNSRADQEDATGRAGCTLRDADAQGAPGLSGVSTRLKADSRLITQEVFLQVLKSPAGTRPMQQLFDFWRSRPQHSRSNILTLSDEQHDVLYALAGCSDVAFSPTNISQPVRVHLREVLKIDRVSFNTWFKNRRKKPSRAGSGAKARAAAAAAAAAPGSGEDADVGAGTTHQLGDTAVVLGEVLPAGNPDYHFHQAAAEGQGVDTGRPAKRRAPDRSRAATSLHQLGPGVEQAAGVHDPEDSHGVDAVADERGVATAAGSGPSEGSERRPSHALLGPRAGQACGDSYTAAAKGQALGVPGHGRGQLRSADGSDSEGRDAGFDGGEERQWPSSQHTRQGPERRTATAGPSGAAGRQYHGWLPASSPQAAAASRQRGGEAVKESSPAVPPSRGGRSRQLEGREGGIVPELDCVSNADAQHRLPTMLDRDQGGKSGRLTAGRPARTPHGQLSQHLENAAQHALSSGRGGALEHVQSAPGAPWPAGAGMVVEPGSEAAEAGAKTVKRRRQQIDAGVAGAAQHAGTSFDHQHHYRVQEQQGHTEQAAAAGPGTGRNRALVPHAAMAEQQPYAQPAGHGACAADAGGSSALAKRTSPGLQSTPHQGAAAGMGMHLGIHGPQSVQPGVAQRRSRSQSQFGRGADGRGRGSHMAGDPYPIVQHQPPGAVFGPPFSGLAAAAAAATGYTPYYSVQGSYPNTQPSFLPGAQELGSDPWRPHPPVPRGHRGSADSDGEGALPTGGSSLDDSRMEVPSGGSSASPCEADGASDSSDSGSGSETKREQDYPSVPAHGASAAPAGAMPGGYYAARGPLPPAPPGWDPLHHSALAAAYARAYGSFQASGAGGSAQLLGLGRRVRGQHGQGQRRPGADPPGARRQAAETAGGSGRRRGHSSPREGAPPYPFPFPYPGGYYPPAALHAALYHPGLPMSLQQSGRILAPHPDGNCQGGLGAGQHRRETAAGELTMGHGAAAGWQGRDTEQASSSECSGASGSGDNGEEGGWSCDEAYPVPLSQVGNGGHSRHGAGARGHLGMQQAGMQWHAGHHQGYHGYDGHVAAAGHAHGHALGASRHAPPGLWPGQGGGHGLPQFHP